MPDLQPWSRLRMGVDYYPEHWDVSMWEEDALLMKRTGVKIVRLAEFAWSRLEPAEGQFDFTWLDQAVDLFHHHDIGVVLGTPTNTPPRWLTDSCPDVLPITASGQPVHAGVRGHRCFNSPSMRTYASRIVHRLAEHYAGHPAVEGWQIDNEYWLLECHCTACNERFREWVKAKYETLDEVNRSWGTVVWSGEFNDWTQITTPLGGSPFQNPSYLLDYYRFQSASAAEFQQEQIALLRKLAPEHYITHNFHSYPQKLDLHQIGEELDFASFDYYPNTSPDKTSTGPYSGALSLDLTRGIKQRGFWIMEQLSGPPGCWFPMWRTPQPGFIRAFAWQTIARGADTVVHFRWRSALQGAEQYWHGLIDHSNVPGRRFEEFTQLCEEVNKAAANLSGTTVQSEAAILYASDQLLSMGIQKQSEGLDYYENIKQWHKALTKLGIGVDVIHTDAKLDSYKLVIAPHLYLMDEALAERLESYAASGGTVILTTRSGVKQMNNICHMEQLPALLSRCAGVTVSEYDPIGKDAHIITTGDASYACSQWNDLLVPQTAEPIAWYNDDFYCGTPAVTRNRLGEGTVYYTGTQPEEAYLIRLLREAASVAGLSCFDKELPEGVQLTVRTGEQASYLFVLNLSREEAVVELEAAYPSLLTGEVCGRELTLPPYGVEILELPREHA